MLNPFAEGKSIVWGAGRQGAHESATWRRQARRQAGRQAGMQAGRQAGSFDGKEKQGRPQAGRGHTSQPLGAGRHAGRQAGRHASRQAGRQL